MKNKYSVLIFLSSLLIGCSTSVMPPGPSVSVMPAPGKSFDVFQSENAACKDFAQQQIGSNADNLANQQVVDGAVSGAALGAAAGVLMGGNSEAAAAGAGMGTVMGSAVGSDNAARVRMEMQRRYDIAYQQCMYSKGNQVPGYRTSNTPSTRYPSTDYVVPRPHLTPE